MYVYVYAICVCVCADVQRRGAGVGVQVKVRLSAPLEERNDAKVVTCGDLVIGACAHVYCV